jgi:hypothetical protein
MAFKKGSSKKKKTKGKKGRKDGWNLEGGQFVSNEQNDAANISEGNSEVRKSRNTQEKDERIRRGKLKIEAKKLKKNAEKKLAKKIRFGDVVESDRVEHGADTSTEKSNTVAREKHTRHRSSLSILDRLQHFVSLSSTSSHHSEVGDSSDEPQNAGNTDDDDVQEDGRRHLLETRPDEDAEQYEAYRSDDDVSVDDSDDGRVEEQSTHDTYDLLFTSSAAGNVDEDQTASTPTQMQLLNEFTEFQLYGSLSSLVKTIKPIQRLREISGLPRMWRGEGSSSAAAKVKVETFSHHILPILTSYCDTFLEGRDTSNDEAILSAILSHVCVHTVRAR